MFFLQWNFCKSMDEELLHKWAENLNSAYIKGKWSLAKNKEERCLVCWKDELYSFTTNEDEQFSRYDVFWKTGYSCHYGICD